MVQCSYLEKGHQSDSEQEDEMATVKELIKKESNGSISFGNYDLPEKKKLADFEVAGDLYKVKTWNEMTKLERNGTFVYESIPGTAVNVFKESADDGAVRSAAKRRFVSQGEADQRQSQACSVDRPALCAPHGKHGRFVSDRLHRTDQGD